MHIEYIENEDTPTPTYHVTISGDYDAFYRWLTSDPDLSERVSIDFGGNVAVTFVSEEERLAWACGLMHMVDQQRNQRRVMERCAERFALQPEACWPIFAAGIRFALGENLSKGEHMPKDLAAFAGCMRVRSQHVLDARDAQARAQPAPAEGNDPAALVASGWLSTSNRHRSIARLPPHRSAFDTLCEADPGTANELVEYLEQRAKSWLLRVVEHPLIERRNLTVEEFSAFKKAGGQAADP